MVTTIVANDGLVDTIQMTTETPHSHGVQERTMRTSLTDPANTTRTDRARGPAISSQWWKVWVLLSSLGATVVGWVTLPGVKSTTDSVVVSATAATTSAEAFALPVNVVVEPGRPGSRVRSMPAMPQKPVFQAPVTRTRRS